MDELHLKKKKLSDYLKSLGNLVVAFSGGVDSSFLLVCAKEVLSENVIAATINSPVFPKRELCASIKFAEKYKIRQILIDSKELDSKAFKENPADRCYYCKLNFFKKIGCVAKNNDIAFVADGSNIDDLTDFRPGMKAVRECGVVSPLQYAGLTKEDIRILSKKMGIETWNKPSFACLATRIPYGQPITNEKLAVIDKAEQFLIDMGFQQVRVRHHGEVARIELPADNMIRIFENGIREKINDYFRTLGFSFAALDLNGYASGSMNKTLKKELNQTV